MHNVDPSYPHNSGDVNFLSSEFMSELDSAEHDEHRDVAIDFMARQLQLAFDQEIRSEIFFLASGIAVVKTQYGHEIEERYVEAYGKIREFNSVTIGNVPYLVAALESDDMSPISLIMSAEKGYDFTLVPDYPPDYDARLVAKWLKVAEESFDATNFLSTAAQKLRGSSVKAIHVHELNALDIVLQQQYGLYPGDAITAVGTQAFHNDGTATTAYTRPSVVGEHLHAGTFMGLTTQEITLNKNRKLARLSIAIMLADESIVVQPCAAMHSLDTARV